MRAAAVFVISMAMRIWFRASYLVNWDAVNFALGVESFDLEHHQPHPPGYVGYVLLGRLVRWIVGDPVAALTAVSLLSGAFATMWVYILGRRIVSEKAALMSAVLFGTSPLVWYYSGVALTYVVEVALALPLVWLVLEARTRRSFRMLVAATVALVLMGALRQTSLVFFFPVWLYAWLRFPVRARVESAAILSLGTLVWLVPLLVMSGGPVAYLQLSMDLAQLTGGVTWLGAGAGVVQNFAIVATGLILGLHVSLFAVPLASMRRRTTRPHLRHRRLLALWAGPPLFVYLFLHSGQLGYVLILLPIGIYWAANVFESWLGKPVRALAVAGLLVVVNVAGFTVLPELAYGAARDGNIPLPSTVASPWLFERGIRQASLSRSDAHWEALLTELEEFDADTTAVLTEPRDGGSFRHVAFYAPEFVVYGVGDDRNGGLGHLFTGEGRKTDYSVDKLASASAVLELEEGTETLVIPDARLRQAFADVDGLELREIEDGTEIAVVDVPPGSVVLFLAEDEKAAFIPRPATDLLVPEMVRSEMATTR
ncbi:MAG: ArnT family glycosyltransferase [Actinomycetota bacterium]